MGWRGLLFVALIGAALIAVATAAEDMEDYDVTYSFLFN